MRQFPFLHCFVFLLFSVISFKGESLGPKTSGTQNRASAPLLDFLSRAGVKVGRNAPSIPKVELRSARQDYKEMTFDASCHTLTPLQIGKDNFTTGLGMHANGSAVYRLNAAFERFTAQVGIDVNTDTQGKRGSVVFIVKVDGKEAIRTSICRGGEPARMIDVPLSGAKDLELIVTDAGDGIAYDQADWAMARLTEKDGDVTSLSDFGKGPVFLQQTRLPASFVYGGQSSTALLSSWPRQEKPAIEQEDRTIYETTWCEPGGGLVACWRVEVFHDWPAMEFRWIFTNQGKSSTKALTQVHALEMEAAIPTGPIQAVHSTGGTTYDLTSASTGFAVTETTLGALKLTGAGGRSSDRDLPFFLVHSTQPAEGIFVGVGWSGDWEARMEVQSAKQPLHLTVEMPGINLALPPGEQIISPSILLGSYRGDWRNGANLLRQILSAKYMPLLSGVKPQPPVSWNSWFILGNSISEDALKIQADLAAEAGIEYFCIDAGWFEGGFPNGVGNWTIDRLKFPKGLGPIGNYVAKKGMKLGLWFEPERAAAGTRLLREHPEWVHADLVDFGNAKAREWMFQMMKQLIDEGHVGWIRWDFNTAPLNAWNHTDAPDQHGLTQIRHIVGLYQFLDRLMKAYPDLLIEGCASGGRRIDLETIRRSHTFWKSDETGMLPVLRFHETGGNVFLPGGLLNVNVLPSRLPFDLLSVFGGPLGFRCNWPLLDPSQREQIRHDVDLYKQVRHLLNEDYFPLTAQNKNEQGWTGWQFNSPVRGEGFLVVLRADESPYTSASFALKGLDADATYTLTPMEGAPATPRKFKGRELGHEWKLELKTPATGTVIRYSKEKQLSPFVKLKPTR